MFDGCAIGGNKGNGKDFILDYLCETRPNHVIVRCKTPIVERYEEIVGHPYDKGRDDAELIEVSATLIRGGPNGNDHICKDYLLKIVPQVVETGRLVFIPDMRRVPENEAARDHLDLMCLYVWASEETRKRRIIAREGSLDNYKPGDDTEKEVESLRYHYQINNDHDDDGRLAFAEIEAYLGRYGPRFARGHRLLNLQSKVRLIDPVRGGRFFDTGVIEKDRDGFGVRGKMREYFVRYEDGHTAWEDSADLIVLRHAQKEAA